MRRASCSYPRPQATWCQDDGSECVPELYFCMKTFHAAEPASSWIVPNIESCVIQSLVSNECFLTWNYNHSPKTMTTRHRLQCQDPNVTTCVLYSPGTRAVKKLAENGKWLFSFFSVFFSGKRLGKSFFLTKKISFIGTKKNPPPRSDTATFNRCICTNVPSARLLVPARSSATTKRHGNPGKVAP